MDGSSYKAFAHACVLGLGGPIWLSEAGNYVTDMQAKKWRLK